MTLKNSAYLCIVCIILGIGIGYKLFNKPELPPPIVENKSNEKSKKAGTITKYIPDPNCGGKPIIAEVEVYNEATEKSAESNSTPFLHDNFIVDSDFKTELGFRYRPIDDIKIINKLWFGPEYNKNDNELKIKASFSSRI